MSGHSKWNNIKNKKEKSDGQRAKIFTKIGREIAIAVKQGGGDPDNNSRLRDVIAKAKAANMPNDNITRSIKKASGELGNVNYEEITYEGYGPGGVAVIVETATDNKNRTAADIRHCFDRNGGSMGESGCVAWMFDRLGVIYLEKKDGMDDDEFLMEALDCGAEDVALEDGVYRITTQVAGFGAVRQALEDKGYTLELAEIDRIPQNTMTPAAEDAAKIEKLMDMLEDNDDVQNVYHNAELDG